MRQHKTSRGVPLRSTLGMKGGRHRTEWILVADRHRLALFTAERGQGLALREEVLSPEGRRKSHELAADHPGRAFDSHDRSHHGQTGGARHAYGEPDPIETAVTQLVSQAAELIATEVPSDGDTRLTVVAEPRLMGRLREELTRAAGRRELTFEEKDYAWLDEAQLEDRLGAILGPERVA